MCAIIYVIQYNNHVITIMLAFFVDDCAQFLYVMAFTSGIGYAGSDDSHYITVILDDGEEEQQKLYDRPGNDMYPNKGDLWKISIQGFGFGQQCITKRCISRVLIQEGGGDGWNIESIVTVLEYPGRYEILTADFHVNRWIDGDDQEIYKEFALRLV